MPARKQPSEKPIRKSKRKLGREPSCLPSESSNKQEGEHPVRERRSRRHRGAPYGNNNAVTHGLYATILSRRGPEGVSRRVVNNLKGEIVLLKDFTFRLYELGLTLKDPLETASILRAMSLATLAITRLLDKHEEFKPPSPLYVQWKRESDPTFTTEDYPFPGTYDEDDPNPPGDKIEVGLAKANAFMDALDRKIKANKKLPKSDAEDPVEEDQNDDQAS